MSVERRRTIPPRAVWAGFTITFVAYHVASILTSAPAVDLALRVQEARYFRAGIDPYLVMTGTVPPLPELGTTTAYSFASYLLILPLTFVGSTPGRELLFVAFETTLLVASLRLTARATNGVQSWMLGAVGLGLFGSVFFLQHILNLNYAIVGGAAATLALLAGQRGSWWQGPLGLVLVAVKPSFAIPVALVLLARRDWRTLVIGGGALTAMLLGSSIWLGRNPVSLVLNSSSVADRFNTGYEGGLIYLAWQDLSDVAVPFGIAVCALAIVALRRRLDDDRIALAIALGLGISLFYNHVHAWTGAFPLILIAAALSGCSRQGRAALALLLGFLLVPRLLQFVPLEARDPYMVGHNAVRFGVLLTAVALIARAATASSVASDAALVDAPPSPRRP